MHIYFAENAITNWRENYTNGYLLLWFFVTGGLVRTVLVACSVFFCSLVCFFFLVAFFSLLFCSMCRMVNSVDRVSCCSLIFV